MAMSASGSSETPTGFSAQRRFQIGTNVAIAVVGAAVLLFLVNWIGALRHVRRDVSSYGGYGLSDRTKGILRDLKGDATLSVLYSEETARDATRYVDRVMDYLDEVHRAAPQMKVEQIRSHADRARLVGRITGAFGGEADKHKTAIASFRNFLTEWKQAAAQQMELGSHIQSNAEAWLNDFPLYADVIRQLHEEDERLAKASEQVEQFTASSAVPKYHEAGDRIKGDLTTIKNELSNAAKAMNELATLADAASKPDFDVVRGVRDVTRTLPPLIGDLQKIIGAANDPLPSDLKKTLKQFADRGVKADEEIQKAVRQIDAAGRRYRALADHSLWSVNSPVAGGLMLQIPLTRLLSETGRQFSELRLQLLGMIDKGDPELLERAIRRLRKFTAELDRSFSSAAKSLNELADRIVRIDPVSKSVLEKARDAGFMKPTLAAVEKLTKELEALPPLKLGTLADDIREDNILVLEVNKKVRVLKFDEVWPVRQVINDPSLASEEAPRAFNGDTVIAAALLALTREHPFATVILTNYEVKQDPSMRSFSRPAPPIISVDDLSALRKRLEESNFKVVNWDLTRDAPPPKPEEGTSPIYVILPPAPPSPPNPFGGPPPAQFGEKQQKRIEEALAGEGRAIFLIAWDVRPGGPFGMGLKAPEYPLADYLKKQWGISVETDYRVTWVVPDSRKPNQVGVSAERFQFIPVNYFTNQPIGKPFQTTTLKITDACPLKIEDTPPEGVHVDKVLEVPASEEFIGADLRQLITMINEINNPASSGFVARSPLEFPGPFTLMVAARKDKAGQIVVCSFARSLSDPILTRPLLRQLPDGRLASEPPPIANAELLVNSLYWLHGQNQWIASGPPSAPSIRAIGAEWMTFLRVLTYGVWPALVFAPGLVIWFTRRR